MQVSITKYGIIFTIEFLLMRSCNAAFKIVAEVDGKVYCGMGTYDDVSGKTYTVWSEEPEKVWRTIKNSDPDADLDDVIDFVVGSAVGLVCRHGSELGSCNASTE
ncbi:hypothetical protein [Pyrobaculum sp.]|uniref:hypothetical protein n=1 Tax=Pyrobaculum sp. TaxID=2004705 RepID=UPI003160455F